jgi:hypothetical protein
VLEQKRRAAPVGEEHVPGNEPTCCQSRDRGGQSAQVGDRAGLWFLSQPSADDHERIGKESEILAETEGPLPQEIKPDVVKLGDQLYRVGPGQEPQDPSTFGKQAGSRRNRERGNRQAEQSDQAPATECREACCCNQVLKYEDDQFEREHGALEVPEPVDRYGPVRRKSQTNP